MSTFAESPDPSALDSPTAAQPPATRTFADRLHVFLGVSWVAMWLSDIFEQIDESTAFPLYYPLIGFFVMYFVMVRPVHMSRLALRPLFLLWTLTALIPIFLYFFGEQTPAAYVSMRVRIVCYSVVAGTAVFLMDPGSIAIVRRAALIALAIAIPINLFELVGPALLTVSEGRSAGFYENPNNSAAAIIICMILAVDFTKHTRLGFLIIGAGALAVLTTFSRAGILFVGVLAVAYVILPRGRESLPAVQRMAILLMGFFGAALTIAVILNFVDLSAGAKVRLMSVITADFTDASSAERVDAARWAFDQFLEHFWTGRGLGAPEYYDLRTHNSYVHIGVEYGIGGLTLYLVILLAGLLKVAQYGWDRAINLTLLAGFLFYNSAFDHYVHVKLPFAVAFSVVMIDALVPDRFKNPDPATSRPVGSTLA